MSFREQIPGTFGTADLKFALHPLDGERAIELLKACYMENVPLQDLLMAIEDFLRKKSVGAQHIKEQITTVEEKFSDWLY